VSDFKQGLELCIQENKRKAVREEGREGRWEKQIEKEERSEERKVKREQVKAKNGLLAPRGEGTIAGSPFMNTDNVQYSIKQSTAADSRVLSFSRLWIRM
jgi:hypothetical protein